ncbi:MAG: hypothetical protein IJ682_02755 [Lachnospiraceae bacterium]|nr:hypothetical protein [Lachnospiraceae bacterium]
MYYRILGNQDLIGIRVLTDTVIKALDKKEWWRPVMSEERHYFDQTWTFLNGCFLNDGTMVAMSGLFMNPEECAEHALEADLDPVTTAELSRCMVLGPFRGRKITLRLNMDLIDYAKMRAKTDLVAAVHPDNAAMAQSLIQLGMKPERNMDDGLQKYVIYRMKL